MHSIHRLRELGQSAWLDFLDRALLVSGELDRMIANDALAGMTSNPTIFQKAMAGSNLYDEDIRSAAAPEPDARVFERIAVADISSACDRFRALYDQTQGKDGFVSIEVSPTLANETTGTIAEVRRLWSSVSRPNLMVKIPGTLEGLPAIEECLREGMNINVTLLFSVARYLEVAHAHRRALEARANMGERIDRVASVASFFVSRIDTKVDKLLDKLPDERRPTGRALRGKMAIANAKLAYDAYTRLVAEDAWRAVADAGARPQRLLWGSTSTKDPAYPDVYYVDALIAPDTVDTMPLETFRAYADHGQPEVRIDRDVEVAREQFHALESLGIDFDTVTRELEEEGVRLFAESYEKTLATISAKRRAVAAAQASPQPSR